MLTLEDVSARVQYLKNSVDDSLQSLNKMAESHASLCGQYNEALLSMNFIQSRAKPVSVEVAPKNKAVRKRSKKKDLKEVAA